MSKQVLSIEQMLHLQELGFDTSNASASWYKPDMDTEYMLMFGHLKKEELVGNEEGIPSYTLQDVLDALPRFVIDEEGNKYYLQIEMMNTEFDDWRVSYKSVGQDESPLGYFQAFQLIDAAVRMLVLCYEQGYVETNKNE